MSFRSRDYLRLVGSSSPSRTAVEQEFLEGRRYLFDLINRYTNGIPQAFTQVGGQLLKRQLANVRITPGQVGQLDRWLKQHNGMRRMNVHDLDACRARLDDYLVARSWQRGSAQHAFEVLCIDHGCNAYGERETLMGFYLRVLEFTQPSSRTTPPPRLQLV